MVRILRRKQLLISAALMVVTAFLCLSMVTIRKGIWRSENCAAVSDMALRKTRRPSVSHLSTKVGCPCMMFLVIGDAASALRLPACPRGKRPVTTSSLSRRGRTVPKAPLASANSSEFAEASGEPAFARRAVAREGGRKRKRELHACLLSRY